MMHETLIVHKWRNYYPNVAWIVTFLTKKHYCDPTENHIIIDHSPHEHLFFKEALKKLKLTCNVLFAWDGQEALAILKSVETLPDIIFLDLNMPKMDGLETLVELSKTVRLYGLPVVLYTTSRLEREVSLAKEFGAWWFLNKPPMHLLPQALQCIFEGCDTRVLADEIMLKKFK